MAGPVTAVGPAGDRRWSTGVSGSAPAVWRALEALGTPAGTDRAVPVGTRPTRQVAAAGPDRRVRSPGRARFPGSRPLGRLGAALAGQRQLVVGPLRRPTHLLRRQPAVRSCRPRLVVVARPAGLTLGAAVFGLPVRHPGLLTLASRAGTTPRRGSATVLAGTDAPCSAYPGVRASVDAGRSSPRPGTRPARSAARTVRPRIQFDSSRVRSASPTTTIAVASRAHATAQPSSAFPHSRHSCRARAQPYRGGFTGGGPPPDYIDQVLLTGRRAGRRVRGSTMGLPASAVVRAP